MSEPAMQFAGPGAPCSTITKEFKMATAEP